MLIEFLLERRKSEYLQFVNMTSKDLLRVRLLFVIMFLMMGMGLTMFILKDLNQLQQYGIPVLAAFLGFKFPYFKLMKDKKAMEEKVAGLFPEFLQAFSTAELTNKIMFQTLKASVPFTPQPIKARLVHLLEQIDENGDKREYYMEFAQFINTPDAYIIMDQIYKFSVQGYKEETMEKLRNNILEIQKNNMEFVINKKTETMDSFGIIPLLATMIFIVIFAGTILIHEMNSALDLI